MKLFYTVTRRILNGMDISGRHPRIDYRRNFSQPIGVARRIDEVQEETGISRVLL